MACIGILGGTFDPIHYGHLRTALELQFKLSLDEVRFVPSANPPHRGAPVTPGALRLRMVRAAVRDQPGFVVDDRELARDGPSYSVDTLESLRAELGPDVPLCMIIGMDAFLGLPNWHEWRSLLRLAHIVVAHRPGWHLPEYGTLGELLERCGTSSAAELHERPCGFLHVEAVTQLEISATGLRSSIAQGLAPNYLLPPTVGEIIAQTHCYARNPSKDTSSA